MNTTNIISATGLLHAAMMAARTGESVTWGSLTVEMRLNSLGNRMYYVNGKRASREAVWFAYENEVKAQEAAAAPADKITVEVLQGSGEWLTGFDDSNMPSIEKAIARADHITATHITATRVVACGEVIHESLPKYPEVAYPGELAAKGREILCAMVKAKEYIAIAVWGQRLGSLSGWIKMEQERAARMNAPIDALYERNGEWTTVRDLAADHDFRRAYAHALRKAGLDIELSRAVDPTLPTERAKACALECRAEEAGVTVAVEHINGDLFFTMTADLAGRDYAIQHRLCVSQTNDARLIAHLQQFCGTARAAIREAQA